MKALCTALAIVACVAAGAAGAQESTVLSVSAKPANARAGTPVSLTAAGKGFCGAVHVDWGDGTAITYPTSTLPVAQSHVYQYGGTYTIRAQGMANCSGQATTSVRIDGPRPPPPPPPSPPPPPPEPPSPPAKKADRGAVEKVSVRPEARVGAEIVVIVQGSGKCTVTVDFDDGTQREVTGTLPARVTHRFERTGDYEIVAWGQTPCTGGGAADVQVR